MTKSKRNKGYTSYNFVDKDPAIDIARTCVQIYAKLANISFDKAITKLSRETGVSVHCMHEWFYGDTCSPYFKTIAAVVYGAGREITFNVETSHRRFIAHSSRPRFKSIRGGKAA